MGYYTNFLSFLLAYPWYFGVQLGSLIAYAAPKVFCMLE
jgi:hypothetical protein